jgi:hypothetical protein
MTRNGALLQGARGDGKTVTSAGFTQLSDAAAAGDVVAKSRTEYPPAISKNAVTAAAKRRARSI